MNGLLTNPLPVNMDKHPQQTSSNNFETEFLIGVISMLAIGILFYNLYWWILTR